MRGMKFMILLCVAVALFGSGCMSVRVETNLKPEMNANLKASAGPFYIAGLQYHNLNSQMAQGDAEIERGLLPVLRRECMNRYPGLFVDETTKAIPLGVDLKNTTTMHDGKTIGWMFGTLMLCGMVFPCPGQSDEDMTVGVRVWSGQETLWDAPLTKNFRRENHMWVSIFTPLALITIPGESDFPKMSGTILDVQAQQETYYQQIAQQVATVLAKMVVTKDAAYWAAQPRGQSIPAVVPMRPVATPAPLPAPAQTPAPF